MPYCDCASSSQARVRAPSSVTAAVDVSFAAVPEAVMGARSAAADAFIGCDDARVLADARLLGSGRAARRSSDGGCGED